MFRRDVRRARTVLVAATVGASALLLNPSPAQAWNCHDVLGPETCDAIYGADDDVIHLVNEVYADVAAFGNETYAQAMQAVDEQRAKVIETADYAYATVRCYASGECQP